MSGSSKSFAIYSSVILSVSIGIQKLDLIIFSCSSFVCEEWREDPTDSLLLPIELMVIGLPSTCGSVLSHSSSMFS